MSKQREIERVHPKSSKVSKKTKMIAIMREKTEKKKGKGGMR